MHTRQSIETLQAVIKALTETHVRLPTVSESEKLVRALGAPEISEGPPDTDFLRAVRQRIQAAATGPDGLAALSPRDLRDAVWLLWTSDVPMIGIAGLLERIAQEAARRSSVKRSLIDAWIRDFSPDGVKIGEGGEAIRRLLAGTVDARLEVWRRGDRDVHLFDVKQGPRRFAERLLMASTSVADGLRDSGFADPIRATSGYMRQVVIEGLTKAPDLIRSPASNVALPRLFDLLTLDGALRFREPRMRGATANGLLDAWIDGGKRPDELRARDVQRFLLHHLSDPRLKPQNWSDAKAQATAEIRRWLAKTSLKVFFDLIGQFALDSQFEYRRAFWEAYLEKGHITDAWLGLGKKTHTAAKTIPDLGGAFARLSGAQSDQSILLMRIGDLIFCEWSHNGKLRAWSANWKNTPPLNKSEYAKVDVMGLGLPFPPNPRTGRGGNTEGDGIRHDGASSGHWQGSVAELIKRTTEIDL